MDVTRNNRQVLSKIATDDGHGQNSPYFHGLKAYSEDPFHPSENPNGVIQMGLAENQLSFDLIEDWIKANPTTSICTREGVHKFRDIANFQDYHGLPEFRNGLAKFMGRVRSGRVIFDPDRIVMAGGATGANEMIIFCLADPGDAFLLPSPYYASFERDLGWRTGVQLVPVHCNSSNNFKITRAALEQALARARHKNMNVKGLIITNPWNPLGTTLDPPTVQTILRFTNHHNIHLVADEIYSATVFASPGFVSVSQIIQETDGPINRNLVHLVYSLSKDMGFPGFRDGVLYSYNDAVVSCARKMSSFGLVSSQTQHLLAAMLSDEVFVGKFLAESARRLRRSHDVFTEGLREVSIGCLEGNAGLFCWVDLRRLLKEETFEGEMELWKVIVNEVKLNVSPGSSFHCAEPGWFRICFANMDDHTLHLALNRIKTFVGHREALSS